MFYFYKHHTGVQMNFDQIKMNILKIFNNEFEKDYGEQQLNDILVNEQFDSIEYVKFIVSIESKFEIEFDDEVLAIDTFRSIHDIAEYIQSLL